MGTNYYHIKNECSHCGRGDERVHIGKASHGWPFSVHIIPEANITSWKDWYELLKVQGRIEDEYGDAVTLSYLDELVVGKRVHKNDKHVLDCYIQWPNHSRPDPETGDKLSTGDFS